ncbi:phenylalanyl-tRNA synthetase [Sporormia fimetaria CBS 119925]|uniref:Phenylalanine--tRNA ligase, mitochondrial n=1 Tax=Sporormia fimetaria CBS 119925 TaxID=1340428 RepID=A0A6A6VEK7_9PLEO|nr:phenylalanyl-tRNA synthetase [Sporormia fimetaria CBS 119925]
MRIQPVVAAACRQRGAPNEITIENKTYATDSWTNTPPSILAAIPRRLHLQPNHPLSITRQLIESRFPTYETHNNLFPVVSVAQNFDSLGFPLDHVGRSKTDTYYINSSTVLRTHTSAHQADTFRADTSPGYLISADVYRRDAIDRSHYPVFHQMEGARTWDRNNLAQFSSLEDAIWADVHAIPKHSTDVIQVSDPNPTYDADRNPLQPGHSAAEIEAVAAHLKRSLEDMVVTIFTSARSATSASPDQQQEPLKVRWVEAYFPFTSPSWELEVFWQNDWLEVLGCGVVQHSILSSAGVPSKLGWAFGLGLERIAMLLYGIPDIRLFWSTDPRFLSQFNENEQIRRFTPFSKYPACIKDVSFWLPKETKEVDVKDPRSDSDVTPAGGLTSPSTPASSVSATTTSNAFHENDVMEIAREVCGDLIEDVRLVDEFTHPKTGKRSLCYRANYRSLERTLTNEETNELHERFTGLLVERLGVELR